MCVGHASTTQIADLTSAATTHLVCTSLDVLCIALWVVWTARRRDGIWYPSGRLVVAPNRTVGATDCRATGVAVVARPAAAV